jgi:hypothetical protein
VEAAIFLGRDIYSDKEQVVGAVRSGATDKYLDPYTGKK